MNRILTFFLVFISISISALSQGNIKGKVISNDNNEAMIGVSVAVKGTTIGTLTDIDGNFSINAPANSILLFTFIGYEAKELTADANTFMNVSIEPKVEKLTEVVVVGYGTQKKIDLTSAIATLSPKELSKMPGSVADGIQGNVAGVQVTNGKIRIRGVGTINNTDPLWVVDGLIDGSVPGDDEVESIQVLKDAASCAIYGSRGANGVIIVTTKKGKKGDVKVNYHGYKGFKNVAKKIDMLNSKEHAELANELVYNYKKDYPRRPQGYFEAYQNPDSLGNGTDWQEEWFQAGEYENHSIGLSGGGENASFRISGEYGKDKGIVIYNNSTTYNFHINSEIKKGRFTIGESFNIASNERRVNNQPISEVWRFIPELPVYNDTAIGGYSGPTDKEGIDYKNPVGHAALNENRRLDYSVKGAAYVNVEIIPGLNYKFNFGYSQGFNHTYDYTGRWTMGTKDNQAYSALRETANRSIKLLYENTLNFDKEIGKHNIGLLGGITSETFNSRSVGSQGDNLPADNIRVLGANLSNLISAGSIQYWAMYSMLGRINYGYDSKYLFTANMRRDGSSKFTKANQYSKFYSYSVGYRISEEPFLKNQFDALNNLKLRASYGSVGSQTLGLYQNEQTLKLSQNYIINDQRVPAFLPWDFSSTGLIWETSYTNGLGFDAGFFKDKLTFTYDYFVRITEKMLIQSPIPISNGAVRLPPDTNYPWANAGGIKNVGHEFIISYKDKIGDLNFNISGNFTTVKNLVLELARGNTPIVSGKLFPNGSVTKTEKGGTIGAFYGYKTDGLYQTTAEIDAMNRPKYDAAGNVTFDTAGDTIWNVFAGYAKPGDVRFKDLNGDGLLDSKDMDYIGSPIPKQTFGLNLDLSYKMIDFAILFMGDYGFDIYNQGIYFYEGMQNFANNRTAALDRWRGEEVTFTNPLSGKVTVYPKNTDTNIPRATLTDPNGNLRQSDRFIEDGSFMRIKRITIGFTAPSNWIEKVHIASCRLYIGFKNPFTFTKYTGYDPEIGVGENLSRNIDAFDGNSTSPLAREVFAGLQIEF